MAGTKAEKLESVALDAEEVLHGALVHDIPILPQLLAKVPASDVARLRRGLGCIWPRMLWLAPGLHTAEFDDADVIKEVRRHDAFATLMWNLRQRLGLKEGAGNTGASWRVRSATCPAPSS